MVWSLSLGAASTFSSSRMSVFLCTVWSRSVSICSFYPARNPLIRAYVRPLAWPCSTVMLLYYCCSRWSLRGISVSQWWLVHCKSGRPHVPVHKSVLRHSVQKEGWVPRIWYTGEEQWWPTGLCRRYCGHQACTYVFMAYTKATLINSFLLLLLLHHPDRDPYIEIYWCT